MTTVSPEAMAAFKKAFVARGSATNDARVTRVEVRIDVEEWKVGEDTQQWAFDIEVSVTDGRGGWAWSNFTLRVLNVNEAPHDARIMASGDYIEGKDQQLNATASDPDIKHGDTLIFKWTSDISGDLGTGPSIVVSLLKGNHMITLTVTDSEGLSTTKSTVMEILEPKDDTSSSPGLTGIVAVAVIVMGAALRSRGLISNNLRNRKEEK